MPTLNSTFVIKLHVLTKDGAEQKLNMTTLLVPRLTLPETNFSPVIGNKFGMHTNGYLEHRFQQSFYCKWRSSTVLFVFNSFQRQCKQQSRRSVKTSEKPRLFTHFLAFEFVRVCVLLFPLKATEIEIGGSKPIRTYAECPLKA
jgi:hypothetical protein